MRIVDGQGKIIPDSFAETRITSLPPGVGAVSGAPLRVPSVSNAVHLFFPFFSTPQIIVVFNRNHNWICERLLQINERGTWTADLKNLKREAEETPNNYQDENFTNVLEKQDYEIFQTARLINSLTYANIVQSDFLAAILGNQR